MSLSNLTEKWNTTFSSPKSKFSLARCRSAKWWWFFHHLPPYGVSFVGATATSFASPKLLAVVAWTVYGSLVVLVDCRFFSCRHSVWVFLFISIYVLVGYARSWPPPFWKVYVFVLQSRIRGCSFVVGGCSFRSFFFQRLG